MIKLDELLKGVKADTIPKEHLSNLNNLVFRMNQVRSKWGKPMIVTSGYRSMADHLRIYKQKGITDPKKIPMGSKHLSGQAVDIADPKGELMEWCKANTTFLRAVGLWLEDGTKGWVHFQSAAFGSYRLGGTIFFYP